MENTRDWLVTPCGAGENNNSNARAELKQSVHLKRQKAAVGGESSVTPMKEM